MRRYNVACSLLSIIYIQLISSSFTDEILSDWHYANWMPNPGAGRRSFRIKHHGSLRKAKVEVIEPGIYYLYSQVSILRDNIS